MKATKVFGFVFTLIVIAVIVCFFAFEKPIPNNWGEGRLNSLNDLSVTNYDDINKKIGNTGCKNIYKKYEVNASGTKTLSQHQEHFVEKVGVDENLRLHYTEIEFNTEGQEIVKNEHYLYRIEFSCKDVVNGTTIGVDGDIWKQSLLNYYIAAEPVNADGSFAYSTFLSENLKKTSQRSIYLYYTAEADNTTCFVTYDFLNRHVTSINVTKKQIISENHYFLEEIEYQFTFPKEIVLPEA